MYSLPVFAVNVVNEILVKISKGTHLQLVCSVVIPSAAVRLGFTYVSSERI